MAAFCAYGIPCFALNWIPVAIIPRFLFFPLVICIFFGLKRTWNQKADGNKLVAFSRFFYTSFLKARRRSFEDDQQSSLESFYKAQAASYDSTRKSILRGRRDMLELVAAQLRYKIGKGLFNSRKPVWVDIGGGTGYNIEVMSKYLPVDSLFSKVYLVDLSPSLCDVARKRFQRLGWKNVVVLCEDARNFSLEKYEQLDEQETRGQCTGKADLITMSYSLSMIPDYHSVIDSLSSILDASGILGACDFYVQSYVDVASRSYIGGAFNRHVNWLGRSFWRAWFDADHISLDAGRRDYLEYRFGTVLTVNGRNYLLGAIPYYIFIGCQKELDTSDVQKNTIEAIDSSFTESPYLSPVHHQGELSKCVQDASATIRSKAYECAIVNLSANLPLPAAFYQNHHWRIFYDDSLKKHTQFGDQYIYAFTWEDPKADQRLLKIGTDDVILAITSAGDNILDYLLHSPKRVHAVDLNPNQNHLLELKAASLCALSREDVWKLFGEGKHPRFRELLTCKLSPHMSSRSFQYWLQRVDVFSPKGRGLYETGGSGICVKLVRWLYTCFGLNGKVKKLCSAKTLNEQQEIWASIRWVLLSRPLHWLVVSTEWFLWKGAGVPKNQRQMILEDYLQQQEGTTGRKNDHSSIASNGEAMWRFIINTFDPLAGSTMVLDDNYFYQLCLQGKYTKRSCPRYLTSSGHAKLSKHKALDGLRIHTDEIIEVLARMAPETLTIAVIMDSMDWFDPHSPAAAVQIRALNKALKHGGRVLLRSAGLNPWYMKVFERHGFSVRRVGARLPGTYIDRVNMYASTWICKKVDDISGLVRSSSIESTLELDALDSSNTV